VSQHTEVPVSKLPDILGGPYPTNEAYCTHNQQRQYTATAPVVWTKCALYAMPLGYHLASMPWSEHTDGQVHCAGSQKLQHIAVSAGSSVALATGPRQPPAKRSKVACWTDTPQRRAGVYNASHGSCGGGALLQLRGSPRSVHRCRPPSRQPSAHHHLSSIIPWHAPCTPRC